MSIFRKTVIALALSAAAVLPAAANTPDDKTYSMENAERYMPDRAPAMRSVSQRDVFLQGNTQRSRTPMRQESAPGFGG